MRRLLLVLALAALVPAVATAAPVFSQTQVLTVQGQDMLFAFNALPAPDAGGTITIAPGTGFIAGLDLSGGFPNEDENFEVTFDGVSQGFFSCGGGSNNSSTAIPGATDNSFNFNDCVFSLPFTLGSGAFASLLADNSLVVGVLFGDDVSTFSHNDEVIVTLDYNATVPEPASLLLLGLGFAAIARRRLS